MDIDGTLTKDDTGYGDEVYSTREPDWETIGMLQAIARMGHVIILYTSRYTEDQDVTERWLNRYGVPRDDVLYGKPKWDILLDNQSTSDRTTFLKEIMKRMNR